jgi:hypothetical protein
MTRFGVRGAILVVVALCSLTFAPTVATAAPTSPMESSGVSSAQQQLPRLTSRYCWSWTSGHGLCIKYSRADLNRFEALGIISNSVAAAYAAEEMCSRVPGRYKALCKAGIAGALTEYVVVMRAAQQQRRCVEIRASLNPLSALFERARVVNC